MYECERDLFFRKNNFHNSDGTGAVSHIFMKGVYNCYTYMIAYQAKTMGHKVAFFWFIFFFDLIAITAVDLYEPIGLGNMRNSV